MIYGNTMWKNLYLYMQPVKMEIIFAKIKGNFYHWATLFFLNHYDSFIQRIDQFILAFIVMNVLWLTEITFRIKSANILETDACGVLLLVYNINYEILKFLKSWILENLAFYIWLLNSVP